MNIVLNSPINVGNKCSKGQYKTKIKAGGDWLDTARYSNVEKGGLEVILGG